MMLRHTCALLVGVIGVAGAPALAQNGPANPGFEQEAPVGDAPPGWVLTTPGYRVRLENELSAEGAVCAVLERWEAEGAAPAQPFGNLMQQFDAAPFRGKRVKFSAAAMTDVGDAVGNQEARAQLWLRVDREGGRVGFFDNMSDRPIQGPPDWNRYEIVGDVAPDAQTINLGVLLVGAPTAAKLGVRPARAYIDDVWFEVLGETPTTDRAPAPLSERGLENLTALARLVGYVRFFHPTDAVAATDWDAFTIAAIEQVEPAGSAAELRDALRRLFEPIAPLMVIATEQEPLAPPGAAPLKQQCPDQDEIIWWQHRGLNADGLMPSVYRSTRERRQAAGAPPEAPPISSAVFTEVGGGVRAWMPIALYACNAKAVAAPATLRPERPEGWSPSGNDRAVRLAGVIEAWNVLQHSYPYAMPPAWEGALGAGLREAAEAADDRAQLDVLRRLVSKIGDGHGRVFHQEMFPQYALAVDWTFAGDSLVVTAPVEPATPEGPRRGDVVVRYAGRPLGEVYAETRGLISAASEGWARYNAAAMLRQRESDAPVELVLRGPEGAERTVRLTPVVAGGRGAVPSEPRPEPVSEVRPGVWYIDPSRLGEEELRVAIGQAAEARGVIFEHRCYPTVGPWYLGHLSDKGLTSAQWHTPVIVFPDRAIERFERSGWPVPPGKPRITGKVAFVTDGSAISYAETLLGMVEHFGLGEIVGEPTAATNGNVNRFTVPGGYEVMFTGMKVLKHDGSEHHGVGIRPTVPVSRTPAGIAAGRDEMLEKAIEVVAGRASPEPGAGSPDRP
ncbi:MAG TPA: S41 family peptidase [Phycisphaerales bacterium]|nr:S41 family peptidase [Phycisphaerales bacterium]